MGKPWKCGLSTLKRRTQCDWQQFLICCQQDLISNLCRAIQAKSTKNRELFSTSSSSENLWCPRQGGVTSPDGSSVRQVWYFLWTAASSARQGVMNGRKSTAWVHFSVSQLCGHAQHFPAAPGAGGSAQQSLLPVLCCAVLGVCFRHQQHRKGEVNRSLPLRSDSDFKGWNISVAPSKWQNVVRFSFYILCFKREKMFFRESTSFSVFSWSQLRDCLEVEMKGGKKIHLIQLETMILR